MGDVKHRKASQKAWRTRKQMSMVRGREALAAYKLVTEFPVNPLLQQIIAELERCRAEIDRVFAVK